MVIDIDSIIRATCCTCNQVKLTTNTPSGYICYQCYLSHKGLNQAPIPKSKSGLAQALIKYKYKKVN